MPELLLANKLRQMSHMEILQEGTRPEPRLRRLLGHISTYDNVERWLTDNEQQIFVAETVQYEQAQTVEPVKTTRQSSVVSSEPTLKLRTLAEFQAAVRSHFEVEKKTTVITEEVSSDSDSEDESDSDESLDDESDDESTSSWSDEEDPIIELIKEGTRSLLQQDIKDNVVFYRETSEIAVQAMETEKR